ncbi:tetratricopeptide repeat protein [Thauera sp. JM12B12]|uniref:tetratricopeptide repeat protein n=1 Tax=Thauera sp. JM12B12 TaxID=3142262 RepID=UPI0031F36997
MSFHDDHGLACTGADADSAAHYRRALHQFRCYIEDPVASVDAALALRPDFVMAHALKAWLHLLGTEPAGIPVARACLLAASRLPAWSRAMAGHHAVLGMHAFGLEECGDYVRAEAQGRAGVELEPRDGWAQHAVAHVMEMQGRERDGIAWMRADPAAWSTDSFFRVHNWWHLALYHLELGEIDEVLALYDGPIRGERSTVILDLIDASAMLWRLHLRGIDVGSRWQRLAEDWAPFAAAGNYAFNDVHATMAFVGAGRLDLVDTVLEAQRAAMQGDGDNAAFTREVGQPLTRAIRAFGEGHHAETVRLIRDVREIAHRFGGSHAQRSVLDLTLIEAALRDGQQALAVALCNERVDTRPHSPLTRLLRQRAAPLRAAA